MSYRHQSLLNKRKPKSSVGAMVWLYSFFNLGTRWGGWSMSCPCEKDWVPVVQEAGCVPWPVWVVWKILPPPGFDPWTMQPVVSHYAYYTVPVHHQPLLPITNPTLLLVTRVQVQMFPVKNSLV